MISSYYFRRKGDCQQEIIKKISVTWLVGKPCVVFLKKSIRMSGSCQRLFAGVSALVTVVEGSRLFG